MLPKTESHCGCVTVALSKTPLPIVARMCVTTLSQPLLLTSFLIWLPASLNVKPFVVKGKAVSQIL